MDTNLWPCSFRDPSQITSPIDPPTRKKGGIIPDCGTVRKLGVEPKIGVFNCKMDGENNGKALIKVDDLEGFPHIFWMVKIMEHPN